MSVPAEHLWLPPQPIHHIWTAQSGDTGRLAAATAAVHLRFAAVGVVLGVVVVGTAALVIVGVDHYPWAVVAAGIFLVVMAAAVGVRARRDVAPHSYPGAQWAAGYGGDSLVVSNPVATVIVDYAALRHVRLIHGLVVVTFRARSAERLVLPAQICPPSALNHVCERIDTAVGHVVELRR